MDRAAFPSSKARLDCWADDAMAQYLPEGLAVPAALLNRFRYPSTCSITWDLWAPRSPFPRWILIAFGRFVCIPSCCAMIDAAFQPRTHPCCRSACYKSVKTHSALTIQSGFLQAENGHHRMPRSQRTWPLHLCHVSPQHPDLTLGSEQSAFPGSGP